MNDEKIEVSLNEEDIQNIINCYEEDIEYIKQLEEKINKLEDEQNRDYTSVYIKGVEDGKDKVKQDLIKYLEDKIDELNIDTEYAKENLQNMYQDIKFDNNSQIKAYQKILDKIKGVK